MAVLTESESVVRGNYANARQFPTTQNVTCPKNKKPRVSEAKNHIVISDFIFSYPDYTVGYGITPYRTRGTVLDYRP